MLQLRRAEEHRLALQKERIERDDYKSAMLRLRRAQVQCKVARLTV
jgi:hypothetical protein